MKRNRWPELTEAEIKFRNDASKTLSNEGKQEITFKIVKESKIYEQYIKDFPEGVGLPAFVNAVRKIAGQEVEGYRKKKRTLISPEKCNFPMRKTMEMFMKEGCVLLHDNLLFPKEFNNIEEMDTFVEENKLNQALGINLINKERKFYETKIIAKTF